MRPLYVADTDNRSKTAVAVVTRNMFFLIPMTSLVSFRTEWVRSRQSSLLLLLMLLLTSEQTAEDAAAVATGLAALFPISRRRISDECESGPIVGGLREN